MLVLAVALMKLENYGEFHQIDLSDYKGEQRKDKIARNLVDSKLQVKRYSGCCKKYLQR